MKSRTVDGDLRTPTDGVSVHRGTALHTLWRRGSALVWGTRGRRFETSQGDQVGQDTSRGGMALQVDVHGPVPPPAHVGKLAKPSVSSTDAWEFESPREYAGRRRSDRRVRGSPALTTQGPMESP